MYWCFIEVVSMMLDVIHESLLGGTKHVIHIFCLFMTYSTCFRELRPPGRMDLSCPAVFIKHQYRARHCSRYFVYIIQQKRQWCLPLGSLHAVGGDNTQQTFYISKLGSIYKMRRKIKVMPAVMEDLIDQWTKIWRKQRGKWEIREPACSVSHHMTETILVTLTHWFSLQPQKAGILIFIGRVLHGFS